MRIRFIRGGSIAATLLALAACGGSDSGNSTGQLTIGLTDGPVEGATKVIIAFAGLELKAAGEEPMDPVLFDETSCVEFADDGVCYIDLLELQGDESRVVFSEQVPAGSYEWIRLLVSAERDVIDSYITFKEDETMCSLYIPSGANTGLKIVSGITVTANGTSSYMLDFDVRKSVTAPPGQSGALACAQNYKLKPAIRIVDMTEIGTIAGTVSADTLASGACAMNEQTGEYENVAVYVFDNTDGMAEADDIDGEGDPVTTATVSYDVNEDTYFYEAAFLLSPQEYLLALTCTADAENAEENDFGPDYTDTENFTFITQDTIATIVDERVSVNF